MHEQWCISFFVWKCIWLFILQMLCSSCLITFEGLVHIKCSKFMQWCQSGTFIAFRSNLQCYILRCKETFRTALKREVPHWEMHGCFAKSATLLNLLQQAGTNLVQIWSTDYITAVWRLRQKVCTIRLVCGSHRYERSPEEITWLFISLHFISK